MDQKIKGNKPSKKKKVFSVREDLHQYLIKYNRATHLLIQYEDLERYESALPLLDSDGNDTLWQSVFYSEYDMEEIHFALKNIYAILKTDGDASVMEHLSIARIDYCTFGNSKPFRIRIINRLNDNYDHFYVKKTDASRVYGLELESLVSPNSVTYLVDRSTLIEEHIAGLPGDDFMKNHLDTSEFNKIRIAKEFVKFNERCFVRLLGDMRSYNYVINITPDIEGNQYRMRAIDFDQQSYEGWKSFYLPQYFKENNPIIFLGIKHMSPQTVIQYQLEERTLIAARIKAQRKQVITFFRILREDIISKPEKVDQLRKDLAYHHQQKDFLNCRTMGEIVQLNLSLLLKKDFKNRVDFLDHY